MDPIEFSTSLGTWGYPGLLALLVLTGVGSPIPEDLLLLTAGYLIFAGVFDWPLAFGISTTGVVLSDLILYAAGRHIAWRSERWLNGRVLSPARLQRATRWFARCGDVLVLIARLVPGTRAIVFVAAGMHPVTAWSFLCYDGFGAALWVAAMLVVGHAAGSRIGNLGNVVNWFSGAGALAVVAACVLLAIRLWWGREESKL